LEAGSVPPSLNFPQLDFVKPSSGFHPVTWERVTDVIEPNNAFTLKIRGDVKRILRKYQGALEDLDKADVLEPNNAFTLRTRGTVKTMLDDYQGTLEDLDKADVIEPNNAFTLRTRGTVKYM
jgi:tetratricopeptide (TPR) repeat protein